jgi:chromosome segregation ATPase
MQEEIVDLKTRLNAFIIVFAILLCCAYSVTGIFLYDLNQKLTTLQQQANNSEKLISDLSTGQAKHHSAIQQLQKSVNDVNAEIFELALLQGKQVDATVAIVSKLKQLQNTQRAETVSTIISRLPQFPIITHADTLYQQFK